MDKTNGNLAESPEIVGQYQGDILNALFSYWYCFALKSVIELRIPDIIHSHGKPMSLSQIASKLNCETINETLLSSIMNLLVRKKFFTIDSSESTVDALYGLTPKCKLLLSDHELSLAPFVLCHTIPLMMHPRCEISTCVTKEGEIPFTKYYGQSMWEKASKDAVFSKIFNDAMVSGTNMQINQLLMGYEQGFRTMEGTLVDVGGGVGHTIAAVVKAHPHIKGINFDLPHVIDSAPQHPNVTHVAGDMLKEIPHADAIFMKNILHDWGDDECVTILTNCRKALKKGGKVIIFTIVINSNEGDGTLEDTKACIDLEMAANHGGKERTKQEWNKLFEQANFTSHNIIEMPFLSSIIEAYP